MTGAELLVDALVRAGAGRFFLAPGVDVTHPLPALARGRGSPVTAARSLAGALVLATVTAELTDAPGVALVPAGAAPGAAVAWAAANRAPLIVAEVIPAAGGAIARPAERPEGLKGAVVVEPESAAHQAAHACQLALGHPRGPVHVRVPAAALATPAVPVATAVRPSPPPAPGAAALDALAGRLAAAARPVLVAGMHARGEAEARWLRALAEALPAPVLLTPKARGLVADPHPLAHGPFPPAAAAAPLLEQADLVVAAGLDDAEIAGAARPAAPVVALVRGAGDGATLRPVLEVVGDLALIVEELAPRLRGRAAADWDVAALDRMKRRLAAAGARRSPSTALVRAAREATPAGTAAAADPGVESAVTEGWQSVGPHDLLATLPPAPAGYAVAAALAAALARPGRAALAFTDVAGAAAAAGEVALAVAAGMPVAVLVLNPHGDPVAVGGVTATVVEDGAALGRALGRTVVDGRPALLDCRIAGRPGATEPV